MSNTRQTLQCIFDRMCFHSGAPIANMENKRARFIASLLAYPEDLICAAYMHLQHYIAPHHFPDEADFIQFMQPEYERRQSCEQWTEALEVRA